MSEQDWKDRYFRELEKRHAAEKRAERAERERDDAFADANRAWTRAAEPLCPSCLHPAGTVVAGCDHAFPKVWMPDEYEQIGWTLHHDEDGWVLYDVDAFDPDESMEQLPQPVYRKCAPAKTAPFTPHEITPERAAIIEEARALATDTPAWGDDPFDDTAIHFPEETP